jgi:hypothetical protein|tara:strand:+ start:200 stop:415 length:216 start_codon:yes stop_codon:yes gene_type:complete
MYGVPIEANIKQGTEPMMNLPAKVFNDYAAAAHTCRFMDAAEFRIVTDPKGSGRCNVEILDEDTGEVVGKL